MKKFLILFVITLFLLSFSSISFAAGKKNKPAPAAAAEEQRTLGVVKAVDAQAGTVTIRPDQASKEITLKADKAMLEKQKVKTGSRVRIKYLGNNLTSVQVVNIPVGC